MKSIEKRNAEIVAMFKKGNVTKVAIAKHFGVDEKTVRRAIKADSEGTGGAAGLKDKTAKAAKVKIVKGRTAQPDAIPVGTTVIVGSKVRLSAAGRKQYIDRPFNPHDSAGTVTKITRYVVRGYSVDWENGKSNVYSADDLELVTVGKSASSAKQPVKASSPNSAKKVETVKKPTLQQTQAAQSVKDALQRGEKVEFIMTGDSITLTLGSDVELVDSTHQNYKAIQTAILSGDFKTAYQLMNVTKAIKTFSKGSITVKGDALYYGELEMRSTLVTRILDLMANGDSGFKKLVNFFERLMNNPSKQSVEQLWDFIAHLDVEIDEEGFIVGWKKVRNVGGCLFDSYTGKVPNDVGNIVEMPRHMVNDNRHQTCSQGLHVGAWSYVKGFSGDTITKVRVDPADVVSVPSDYNGQKMRASKYLVLCVVDYKQQPVNFARAADVKRLHVKVGQQGQLLETIEL
ncbi:hypothetical protein Arno162_2 [Pectobacterium phage Arno162]|uniref:RIIB protein n=1 Tax=Pectobacterium phage Arno162 TaxID=2500577 RepID=A0A678ZRE9_9CAUD|nr:hypothetical protein Arno162_2 [Pectobacterium phage Arno162]